MIFSLGMNATGDAGEKKILHKVYSGPKLKESEISTLIYDNQLKKFGIYHILSFGIDGEIQKITPKGSDYYKILPGFHTIEFISVDLNKILATSIYLNDEFYGNNLTFSTKPGGSYKFINRYFCTSETKESKKYLNFLTSF